MAHTPDAPRPTRPSRPIQLLDVHLDAVHVHLDPAGRADPRLDRILAQLESLMASNADLKADLDDIKAGVAAVSTQLTAQAQSIADLKAQLAAGSPITQADLDALDAEAKEIRGALDPLVAPLTP